MLVVGTLAGVAARLLFERLLLTVATVAVDGGWGLLFAVLMAAVATYPLLAVTAAAVAVPAWLSLRLLHVPRAAAVVGLAGLLVVLVGWLLLGTGLGFGGAWPATAGYAAAHGAAWLLVRPLRRHGGQVDLLQLPQ